MPARIERLPYLADVVQDVRSTPAVWHCIVQRDGSREAPVSVRYGSGPVPDRGVGAVLFF
jgi:hypothetical protein